MPFLLLPTISQGEPVLAAISLLPVTGDANRHNPAASQPGRPVAASYAAPIAQHEPGLDYSASP